MQNALVKIGSSLTVDGNAVTIKSIHSGYVVAVDEKGRAKVYEFSKIESLF